jgi:hypothetical protein
MMSNDNLINGISYLQYFDTIYMEVGLNFSDICTLSVCEACLQFTIYLCEARCRIIIGRLSILFNL